MFIERLLQDQVARAIPAAAILAYVPFIVKLGMMCAFEGIFEYDNRTPRETKVDVVFASKPDWAAFAKRCSGAHYNGLESLALFGPAVAFAVARGVPDSVLGPYCTNFLLIRVAYNIAYLCGVNQPIAYTRTALFFSGFFVCIGIIAEGARAK